jgi:uncharacterized LabA/DUF88 family protein
LPAPDPTPKKGSGAFRAAWERVLAALDLPRFIVVIEGAIDRRELEEILRKALKGRALRPGAIPRPDLVAAVAETCRVNEEVAFLVMRALDRACARERNIVGSMGESDLEVRIQSYRAIDFRRERARLIWALLRDGRDAHARAAEQILVEAFESMAQNQKEARALDAASPEIADGLKEKLRTYEEAIEAQGNAIKKELTEKEKIEDERSRLLVKLGERERALRHEESRRKELEDEVRSLREEVYTLTCALDSVDDTKLREKDEELSRVKERARALEKEVARAERNSELHDENEALRAETFELKREAERRREEMGALLEQLAHRERAAQKRASGLREALKTARKLATPSERDPSVVDGEPLEDRVGIFVDAANLAAGARREHGGKFDFISLLPALTGDRRRALAVAFVVDNDTGSGGDFAGFVRALMAAGYEVRQKKPRLRADGTKKADWDMGIAMEILDARHRVDTIVLCSGDGDFLPLVQRLKRWGKRVEVASFTNDTEQTYLRSADEHVPLDRRFVLRA